MGFVVQHVSPATVAGMANTAYAAGRGKARMAEAQMRQQDIARQEARQIQLQQMQMQEQARQQDLAFRMQAQQQQIAANQQYQQRQIDATMQRDQMLNEYALNRMQEQMGMEDEALSNRQRRAREQIDADIEWVTSTDLMSPEEKRMAVAQLVAKRNGIKGFVERNREPSVQEQWKKSAIELSPGRFVVQNANGDWKEFKSEKDDSADQHMKLINDMNKYTIDLLKQTRTIKTEDGSKTEPVYTYEQASRLAAQRFGVDYGPEPAPQQSQPRPSGGYGQLPPMAEEAGTMDFLPQQYYEDVIPDWIKPKPQAPQSPQPTPQQTRPTQTQPAKPALNPYNLQGVSGQDMVGQLNAIPQTVVASLPPGWKKFYDDIQRRVKAGEFDETLKQDIALLLNAAQQ